MFKLTLPEAVKQILLSSQFIPQPNLLLALEYQVMTALISFLFSRYLSFLERSSSTAKPQVPASNNSDATSNYRAPLESERGSQAHCV